MKSILSKVETRLTIFLSHKPKLYALVVGIGIVLFWRGVWHSVDQLHAFFVYHEDLSTIDAFFSPWWDGPISLFSGCLILYFTGAFISSFIGNELILSGLRGEKKLTEKTEGQLENEVRAISDIKDSLIMMEDKITQLERKIRDHHAAS